MTLSREYTNDIVRNELELTWEEYDPVYRCYSNVADHYMREKAKVLGKAFNGGIAAILAGEIAWWVQESCSKRRNKP